MTAKNKSSAGSFTLTRIFDAPRALVFAAWTKPVHLKKWSAPHGFTVPVSRGKLQPGGPWTACMISPQGEKMWLGGVYQEVVPDEKLVFTHAWKGSPETTVVTVRFADHPRGTRMTFTQSGFSSAGSQNGHKGGWTESFERLAEHLTGLESGKKKRSVSGRKRTGR